MVFLGRTKTNRISGGAGLGFALGLGVLAPPFACACAMARKPQAWWWVVVVHGRGWRPAQAGRARIGMGGRRYPEGGEHRDITSDKKGGKDGLGAGKVPILEPAGARGCEARSMPCWGPAERYAGLGALAPLVPGWRPVVGSRPSPRPAWRRPGGAVGMPSQPQRRTLPARGGDSSRRVAAEVEMCAR